MFSPTLAAVTKLGLNAFQVKRKGDSLKFYHAVSNQAVEGSPLEDAIRTLLQAGARLKVKDVGRIYRPVLAADGHTIDWSDCNRGWSTVRTDYTVFQVAL